MGRVWYVISGHQGLLAGSHCALFLLFRSIFLLYIKYKIYFYHHPELCWRKGDQQSNKSGIIKCFSNSKNTVGKNAAGCCAALLDFHLFSLHSTAAAHAMLAAGAKRNKMKR